MRNITKEDLTYILIFLAIFLTGISVGIFIVKLILLNQINPIDCTDYTLNQIKAGDATVECTNQFLEENE